MADSNASNTIIVKKSIVQSDQGAGAWKIALADMMTAMMAFFLVLWLISATDEATLSGIANQFKLTKDVPKPKKAGSDGFFGGDSIIIPDEVMPEAPAKQDTADTFSEDLISEIEQEAFEAMQAKILDLIGSDTELASTLQQIEFIPEKEGLRIQIIDTEDASMFDIGTSTLQPHAMNLLSKVYSAVNTLPNKIIVRGHTDSLKYSKYSSKNNWILSTERAEATRAFLQEMGMSPDRFSKVEGVADVDPHILENLNDPRNRRIGIVLKYQTE